MLSQQLILLIALLSLLTTTNGFVLKDANSRGAWSLRASDPTSSTDPVEDSQRRNVFLASALAFAGTSSALLNKKDTLLDIFPSWKVSEANRQSMVDQALEIIENQCDRRFLHAVVASDYHFLYQLAPLDRNEVSVLRTDEAATVLKSSILTPKDIHMITSMLKDRPMQVDAYCQLGFANPKNVPTDNDDDQIVSIWPLGEQVHFAWMEQTTSLASINANDKLIVDGIDCGRMSLEDALEQGKQVLLRSETYLAVPRSLEKELIAKLRNAFLI